MNNRAHHKMPESLNKSPSSALVGARRRSLTALTCMLCKWSSSRELAKRNTTQPTQDTLGVNNLQPTRPKLIARQHLKRSDPFALATRSHHSQLGLLLTCAILVSAASFSHAQQQQETPLPTVIVRGFLNYRTTVDGTVLLFTPDAGQQAPPASATQPKASSMARIEPTAATTHPPRSSLVYTETLAQPIEPTSVLAMGTATATATDPFQTTHLDSNSFRHQQQPQPQPPSPPQPIAIDSRAAQPDEWRPIQMTPPLKTVASLQSVQPSSTPANQEMPASTTTTSRPPPRPSVQADDVQEGGSGLPKSSETSPSPPTPSEQPAGRAPRRPSLGFSGQGLRPRVPGTAGAVSPSLQSRQRSNAEGAATPNSINGIRRPGLQTSSGQVNSGNGSGPLRSQPQVPSTDPAVLANVSSAFQNRLSNASTRLKNRFKHRQPVAAPSLQATPSSANPASQAVQPSPAAPSPAPGTLSQPKLHNSLIAPDSLLDVASSIEQPTSAARSQALVPQSNRNGAGPSELGSSGPAVGSDEVAAVATNEQPSISGSSSSQPIASGTTNQEQDAVVPVVASSPVDIEPILEPMSPEQQAGTASLSRSGEQRPKGNSGGDQMEGPAGQPARVKSGQLQKGSLSSSPLDLDAMFLSDQPASSSDSPLGEHQASSEPAPSHQSRPSLPKYMKSHHSNSSSLNGKLNGWLGQHHNKFVPRPSAKPHSEHSDNLSHQLAANIQQLAPTPVGPNPNQLAVASPPNQDGLSNNATNSTAEASSLSSSVSMGPNGESHSNGSLTAPDETIVEPMSLQTITRTYSTILETSRTRLVPMQVKSSTGIVTITEDYIMTKLMTAYQTIPAGGEFILADQQLSTRAPYEIFESPSEAESKTKGESVPAVAAPPVSAPILAPGPIETQEQPISLDTSSPKVANNWLHDFSNLDGPSSNPFSNDFSNSVSQQQQQQSMLAMLEQQARDANLAAGFPLMAPNGEPLDQLASQLDPTSLLADGAINIPDLNNPLVLAAAIQNPQLAAVILAAQQLKLKRQQQQHHQKPLNLQQQVQLQPSYSTSFSTTVRPSTYTARDTMYTTRLVSFRDGRTVRTRTVSEPGSVVEQVLTTIVTETIPVTITIKPTGVLAAAGSPATALPGGGGSQSNQATINNALFATQLANILARRQQQLQTSFNNPALMGATGGNLSPAASATPQQLLALQQFIGQQQKRQQQQPLAQQQQQQQQQFQPNFQQLLQSMGGSSANGTSASAQPARQAGSQSAPAAPILEQQQHQATPSLQQAPKSVVSSATPVMNVLGGPLTTTLTSLQTRTYTVHNAFKTIFRTITSTVLIPTVLGAGSTLMPAFG